MRYVVRRVFLKIAFVSSGDDPDRKNEKENFEHRRNITILPRLGDISVEKLMFDLSFNTPAEDLNTTEDCTFREVVIFYSHNNEKQNDYDFYDEDFFIFPYTFVIVSFSRDESDLSDYRANIANARWKDEKKNFHSYDFFFHFFYICDRERKIEK